MRQKRGKKDQKQRHFSLQRRPEVVGLTLLCAGEFQSVAIVAHRALYADEYGRSQVVLSKICEFSSDEVLRIRSRSGQKQAESLRRGITLREPQDARQFHEMKIATKMHKRSQKDSVFVHFVPLRGQ